MIDRLAPEPQSDTSSAPDPRRMALVWRAYARLAGRNRRAPAPAEIAKAETWSLVWVKRGLADLEAAGKLPGVPEKAPRRPATPRKRNRAPVGPGGPKERLQAAVAARRAKVEIAYRDLESALGRQPSSREVAEALAGEFKAKDISGDLTLLRERGAIPPHDPHAMPNRRFGRPKPAVAIPPDSHRGRQLAAVRDRRARVLAIALEQVGGLEGSAKRSPSSVDIADRLNLAVMVVANDLSALRKSGQLLAPPRGRFGDLAFGEPGRKPKPSPRRMTPREVIRAKATPRGIDAAVPPGYPKRAMARPRVWTEEDERVRSAWREALSPAAKWLLFDAPMAPLLAGRGAGWGFEGDDEEDAA